MGVPSRDADGGARPTAGVRRRRRSLQGRRQARVRAGEEAGAGADRGGGADAGSAGSFVLGAGRTSHGQVSFADCHLARQSAKARNILITNILCRLSGSRAVGKELFFSNLFACDYIVNVWFLFI